MIKLYKSSNSKTSNLHSKNLDLILRKLQSIKMYEINETKSNPNKAVVDSKISDARPPPRGTNFFQHYAYVGIPPRVGAPTSGKYWVRHCKHILF